MFDQAFVVVTIRVVLFAGGSPLLSAAALAHVRGGKPETCFAVAPLLTTVPLFVPLMQVAIGTIFGSNQLTLDLAE